MLVSTDIKRDLNLLDDSLLVVVEQILADCEKHAMPFQVFETGRSIERQKWLKANGMSRTLDSKHLVEVRNGSVVKKSKAVDLVLYYEFGGKMVWSWANIGDIIQQKYDLSLYKMLGEMVLTRYDVVHNKSLFNRLVWGGQWAKFQDLPHFEIG